MKNTKSLLALFLACMMVVSCFVITPVVAADNVDVWDKSVDTSWYNTTSTEFTLTTAEQLAGLAQIVNGTADGITADTFKSKTIKLGANIQLQSDADMAGYATWSTTVAPTNEWVPIGSYDIGYFAGTFDGQGHTISGMYMNEDSAQSYGGRAALFGWVNGAVFNNFTVTKSYAAGINCTAIVAAFQNGSAPSFTNIIVTDSTVYSSTDKANKIGNTDSDGYSLLMGKMGGFSNDLNFTNCHVDGYIDSDYAGGAMVGYLSGGSMSNINIINCSSDVSFNKRYKDDRGSGGLIGLLGQLTNPCVSTLNSLNIVNNDSVARQFKINATAERDFGGLVGTVYLKTVGNMNFEGLDVVLDINCHAGTANIADVGGVISYYRGLDLTGKMLFKDMKVSGTINAGQNSGVLLGRFNPYGTLVKFNELEVDKVTLDVDFNAKKGTANAQCNGGVVGMTQKAITTLTVNNLTSTCNFKALSAAASFGAILGSGTITNASVSNSTFNDTFTGTSTNIGGLFGSVSGKSYIIDSVTVDGNVSGTGAVGGIWGIIPKSAGITTIEMKNSVVKANVTSTGEAAGGFIGSFNYATPTISFTDCAYLGNITGTARVGGFVGNISYNAATQVASFTNCLVNSDITGTDQVGGLVGNISNEYTGASAVNCVVLGSLTATGDAGAWIGRIGTADTYYQDSPNELTLDNFYYNMTFSGVSPRLGTFRGYEVSKVYEGADCTTDAFVKCVFYTPNADATSTDIGSSATTNNIAKQPNYKMVDMVKANAGVTLDYTHTCKPVTMSQESAVLTDLDMTLGCEIPGCDNHKVDIDFFAAPFASIRFNDYGLRFAFQIDARHNDPDSVNLGVVIIPTDLLDGELTRTTEGVLDIAATNEFTSANALYKEGATTFSGVLTGIPANAETYARKLTVRAYVVIGEDTYYSEAKSVSYADVAQMIKDQNGADYQNNKTYIDSVLGING